MFVLQSVLVAFVVAIVLVVVYMEARIAFRKSFKPALTESLVGAVIIPTGLGLCYLMFTGWAIWMTLFAYPIFLVAGLIVGLIYRSRDAELLESSMERAVSRDTELLESPKKEVFGAIDLPRRDARDKQQAGESLPVPRTTWVCRDCGRSNTPKMLRCDCGGEWQPD